jgi:hypothetical protein
LREGAYRGQPPVPVEEAEAASLGGLPPQGVTGLSFFGRHKGSPAAFVGVVYAEDEEGAIAVAIEEHNVRPADQWRLFAWPR